MNGSLVRQAKKLVERGDKTIKTLVKSFVNQLSKDDEGKDKRLMTQLLRFAIEKMIDSTIFLSMIVEKNFIKQPKKIFSYTLC